MKRRIILLLLSFYCLLPVANGQPLSYVYIQGDKQTPFYVKLEGEMQPRFGKNYCILSELTSGPIHLEILFQQNVFPAQHFTVLVPEGGSRGFLLAKQQDSFALYDLQQHFYLSNNNSEAEDHMPAEGTPPVTTYQPPPADNASKPKTTKPKEVQPDTIVSNGRPIPDTSTHEHFIEGIILNTDPQGVPVPKGNADTTRIQTSDTHLEFSTPALNSISNSDCPTPLSKEAFGPIYKEALDKADDETRTAYLLSKMDLCYATWQARALAGMLTTDAARFTLLKKIYPRITDQDAFPLLDDLLKEESYKKAFHDLLHPKQ